MQYNLTKKISLIEVVEINKVRVHYTVNGEGLHNNISLPINTGISVDIDLPAGLEELANTLADQIITATYIND